MIILISHFHINICKNAAFNISKIVTFDEFILLIIVMIVIKGLCHVLMLVVLDMSKQYHILNYNISIVTLKD